MIEENEDIHAEPYEDEPVYIPLVKRKGVGRNDLCPCNSGDKYKHCHEKSSKMLMPREMGNLLKILVHRLTKLTGTEGITLTQRAFDNISEDKIGLNIAFDQTMQAWHIKPDVEKPLIVMPNKGPMIPTRRILKPS